MYFCGWLGMWFNHLPVWPTMRLPFVFLNLWWDQGYGGRQDGIRNSTNHYPCARMKSQMYLYIQYYQNMYLTIAQICSCAKLLQVGKILTHVKSKVAQILNTNIFPYVISISYLSRYFVTWIQNILIDIPSNSRCQSPVHLFTDIEVW